MKLELLPVAGMPEIARGDDLAEIIAGRVQLQPGDVLVVAQKVVSKAEGRTRRLTEVEPTAEAVALADEHGTDARMVQVVLDESVRVVRRQRLLIVETRQGFVCANAGVDHSNVPGDDVVTLLPVDADASAARLRTALADRTGVEVGVVISDTFGRAWRMGIENVALGAAGVPVLVDYRGLPDDFGREMSATVVAVGDELAAAAELVMGKTERVPVVVVRGFTLDAPAGTGRDLVRPPELDLFR